MQRDQQLGRPSFAVLAVLVLALVMLSATALAHKEPKTYPEEGKIVRTDLTEWVINSQHQHAHTYTVATNTKSYLLECSHKPLFGSMGEEDGAPELVEG